MKLLELENRLLKDDVTKKQKFIDKTLQNSLKLSQNFDVNRIISVTNKTRKQPPERHYYDNPQKQEENKLRKVMKKWK